MEVASAAGSRCHSPISVTADEVVTELAKMTHPQLGQAEESTAFHDFLREFVGFYATLGLLLPGGSDGRMDLSKS